ncbi:MAG: DUF4091 domain-containing protein [Abditibacteriota bacterium]|nr:DUF4091 domain-containing protein [Abditibacteriota bacterium]
MKLFLVNSTKRVFPSDNGSDLKFYDVYAARNETVSWQIVMYNDTTYPMTCKVSAESALKSRIRLEQLIWAKAHTIDTPPEELDGVGLIPGLIPEPLVDEDQVMIPPFSNRAFWVDTYIPAEQPAGACCITAVAECCPFGGEEFTEEYKSVFDINIADFTVKNKKTLRCLHWFYCDSLCDYYKVEPFTEEFWPVCEKYMRDYSDHGNTMIYLPLFTPPLDGVKRPTQLLGVERTAKDKYSFDFTLADKYVELAGKCGIKEFECVHFFTQWGCSHPIRIYSDPSDEESVLFDPESSATGEEYRAFLSQLIPAIKAWGEERGIFDNIFYHLSDEPHGEEHLRNYKAARDMMREIAPWMKTMDALSDTEIAIKAGVDMPISSVHCAENFIEANIPHWVYYCCGPKGKCINRFMDTPLWKERMLGAAMYKLGALGFLQWGYNYWYKIGTRKMINVYEDQTSENYPGIPMGDAFEVYPSPEGPVDSLRWEVFRELLEDHDLLKAVEADRTQTSLREIINYRDFPRDEGFIFKLRKELLEKYVP